MFRNIIVSGGVGTGTTTLAKGLSEKLGWKYLSAGGFFRAYAKEYDIPLWDKEAVPDALDKKIDYEFLEKMRDDSDYVFDSHYGGWFAKDLPDVYRVLLICDRDLATKRILEREHTHKETPEEIELRRQGLRDKFRKLYSKDDYEDPKLFHLVIDTTKTTSKETIDFVYKKFQTANR